MTKHRTIHPDPVHEAILFAERAHRGQTRKGSDVAYITHPMEVLQILTAMGASQALLIAGLLHDTVEDTDVTLSEIQAAFGPQVAQLVASHTEDTTKDWLTRKGTTLEELKTASRDTRLLVLADKLSNLRSMVSDYVSVGEALWGRFHAPKELQAWYNRAFQAVLSDLQADPQLRPFYLQLIELNEALFS